MASALGSCFSLSSSRMRKDRALLKVWGWEFGGDHGFEMAITRVKATEEIKNLTGFRDRMPDGAKLIGEALQLGAVFVDGQITLVRAAEFSFEVDSTLKLIVEEEALDVGPEREGGEVGLVDDVEDGGGDSVQNPVDNAGVGELPLDRARPSGWASERAA